MTAVRRARAGAAAVAAPPKPRDSQKQERLREQFAGAREERLGALRQRLSALLTFPPGDAGLAADSLQAACLDRLAAQWPDMGVGDVADACFRALDPQLLQALYWRLDAAGRLREGTLLRFLAALSSAGESAGGAAPLQAFAAVWEQDRALLGV